MSSPKTRTIIVRNFVLILKAWFTRGLLARRTLGHWVEYRVDSGVCSVHTRSSWWESASFERTNILIVSITKSVIHYNKFSNINLIVEENSTMHLPIIFTYEMIVPPLWLLLKKRGNAYTYSILLVSVK